MLRLLLLLMLALLLLLKLLLSLLLFLLLSLWPIAIADVGPTPIPSPLMVSVLSSMLSTLLMLSMLMMFIMLPILSILSMPMMLPLLSARVRLLSLSRLLLWHRCFGPSPASLDAHLGLSWLLRASRAWASTGSSGLGAGFAGLERGFAAAQEDRKSLSGLDFHGSWNHGMFGRSGLSQAE